MMSRTVSQVASRAQDAQHPVQALLAEYDAEIARLRSKLDGEDLTSDEAFSILVALKRLCRFRGYITPSVQPEIAL